MKNKFDRYEGLTTSQDMEIFVSLTDNGVIVREPNPDDLIFVAQKECDNNGYLIDGKCAEVIGRRVLCRLEEINRQTRVDAESEIIKLSDFKLRIQIDARKRNGFADYWRRLW